jgi:hypothetical protein
MKDLMAQTKYGDSYRVELKNDLQLDLTGDLMLVERKDLLTQTISKMFLTETGENTLNDLMGTNIYSLMSKWDTTAYINALLEEEIINTLAWVHYITRESSKLSEKINRIVAFKVEQKTDNSVNIYLTLITQDNQLLEVPILEEITA